MGWRQWLGQQPGRCRQRWGLQQLPVQLCRLQQGGVSAAGRAPTCQLPLNDCLLVGPRLLQLLLECAGQLALLLLRVQLLLLLLLLLQLLLLVRLLLLVLLLKVVVILLLLLVLLLVLLGLLRLRLDHGRNEAGGALRGSKWGGALVEGRRRRLAAGGRSVLGATAGLLGLCSRPSRPVQQGGAQARHAGAHLRGAAAAVVAGGRQHHRRVRHHHRLGGQAAAARAARGGQLRHHGGKRRRLLHVHARLQLRRRRRLVLAVLAPARVVGVGWGGVGWRGSWGWASGWAGAPATKPGSAAAGRRRHQRQARRAAAAPHLQMPEQATPAS